MEYIDLYTDIWKIYLSNFDENYLVEKLNSVFDKFRIDSIEQWELLILIMKFHIHERSSTKRFPHSLKERVLLYLNEGNLVNVWSSILSKNDYSRGILVNYFNLLFYGHRICATLFYPFTEVEFRHKNYLQRISRSLLIACQHFSGYQTNSIQLLVDNVNNETKLSILDIVFSDEILFIEFFHCFTSNHAYDWIENILFYYTKKNFNNNKLQDNYKVILSTVLNKVMEEYSYHAIIELCFLQKSYPNELGILLVELLPVSYYYHIISSVALLWGDALFLSKGNLLWEEYLTTILLQTISYMSQSQLTQINGDHSLTNPSRNNENQFHHNSLNRNNIPLIVSLSRGVSAHLDIQDIRVRIHGMKVAKVFSKIMGHDIHFEELDNRNDCDSNINSIYNMNNRHHPNRDNQNIIMQNNIQKPNSSHATKQDVFRNESIFFNDIADDEGEDDDESTDSELEPIHESSDTANLLNDSQPSKSSYYLRECLGSKKFQFNTFAPFSTAHCCCYNYYNNSIRYILDNILITIKYNS